MFWQAGSRSEKCDLFLGKFCNLPLSCGLKQKVKGYVQFSLLSSRFVLNVPDLHHLIKRTKSHEIMFV